MPWTILASQSDPKKAQYRKHLPHPSPEKDGLVVGTQSPSRTDFARCQYPGRVNENHTMGGESSLDRRAEGGCRGASRSAGRRWFQQERRSVGVPIPGVELVNSTPSPLKSLPLWRTTLGDGVCRDTGGALQHANMPRTAWSVREVNPNICGFFHTHCPEKVNTGGGVADAPCREDADPASGQ
ncbi:hypothetical protein IQ07DRAFT_160463 [Pyrenochaeta sp. DS3sAY3a]|nr:hypothetical protein IQ07DRAFT_160463 [Pyrenochaeta sp. DS3sAY3a]